VIVALIYTIFDKRRTHKRFIPINFIFYPFAFAAVSVIFFLPLIVEDKKITLILLICAQIIVVAGILDVTELTFSKIRERWRKSLERW